jgi:hypothetical protein
MENNLSFKSSYRFVYIVDTFGIWCASNFSYDPSLDLVLTYDFSLKSHINSMGGDVFYADHLVGQEEMHENNFIVYEFFKKWHLDKNGNDLFSYRGVPFGFSFRLEFWNDYVSFMRLYFSISKLKNIPYQSLIVSTLDNNIHNVVDALGLRAEVVESHDKREGGFYFPIHKWMDEQIRPSKIRGLLYKIRAVVTAIYGGVGLFLDGLLDDKNKHTVFLQEYHPTKDILNTLRANKKIRLVLCNFSRGSSLRLKLKERLLPIYHVKSNSEDCAALFEHYKKNKYHKLVVDGKDVSSIAYGIIESRVQACLPKTVSTLDSCINYLEKTTVDLEILIANIGFTATLFDCVCKAKGVPSFLIINGLLGAEYVDDSKYADFINSYSESIRDNYFRGIDNVYPLGDPRMDGYSVQDVKAVLRDCPTIVIGASGFNSVDLNSFVAVEFEFLSSVLCSFQKLRDNGYNFKIIIKVRPNGYLAQYEKFAIKYYPNLVDEIVDSVPMRDVLLKADFYISIYSQTLFEASCLGIPVVYYRADNEIHSPPFDMKSELVTVCTENELVTAYQDFLNGSARFSAFLDRKVMEKYVGPLDGKNLERNMAFIYRLLESWGSNDKKNN